MGLAESVSGKETHEAVSSSGPIDGTVTAGKLQIQLKWPRQVDTFLWPLCPCLEIQLLLFVVKLRPLFKLHLQDQVKKKKTIPDLKGNPHTYTPQCQHYIYRAITSKLIME